MPTPEPDLLTAQAIHRLLTILKQMGPCAVAFSGGVDSAVVARAAVEVFGDRTIAVTAVSALCDVTAARCFVTSQRRLL